MSKIIIDYAEKNYLPIHENIIYDDVPILKSPNFKISINYFIYLCIYWVKNIFKLLILYFISISLYLILFSY